MEQMMNILMDTLFVCMLVWCSIEDIRKRVVFNIAIVLLLCLGIVHAGLMASVQNTWWTYPLGMAFAIPFFISWLRGGMGAGDVKLVIVIGFYLGVLNMLVFFLLMIPLIIILMVCSWIKNRTIKERIPIAPVAAFGTIGVVILGYLYALL